MAYRTLNEYQESTPINFSQSQQDIAMQKIDSLKDGDMFEFGFWHISGKGYINIAYSAMFVIENEVRYVDWNTYLNNNPIRWPINTNFIRVLSYLKIGDFEIIATTT